MNSRRHRIVLVLLVTPLIAAPSIATASGYFSFHVGSAGAGFAAGSTDWAIYGAAWDDAGWGFSYESHLAGYGEWVRVDGIGRVWRPWVAAGWGPYTHGRWVWTNAGWTWIAYEPWGYVPHHYGNWAMTTFGWVWVPGWTYRPATVSWVTCGSYVGWYPSPPRGWVHSERAYRHGWNHGYRTGYGSGYRDGWNDARYATWVPWGSLGDDNLSRHAVRYQKVSRTASTHQTRVIAAPERTDVVRRGVTVPQTSLEQRTVTAGDRRITVARPAGFTRSVETHAGDTVRHALSPRVSRSAHEREASPPTTSRVSSAQSNPRDRTGTVQRSPTNERYGSADQRSTRDDRSVATHTSRTSVDSSRSRRDLVVGPTAGREKRDSATNPPAKRGEPRASGTRPSASTSRHSRQPVRGQAGRPDDRSRSDRPSVQHPPEIRRPDDRTARETTRARHQTAPAGRDRSPAGKTDRRSPESGSPRIPDEALIHSAPRGAAPQSTRRASDPPPTDPRRQRARSAGGTK